MNLSETAFVTIENGETFEKSPKFGLRWFTPTHEVDLCGHVKHILFIFCIRQFSYKLFIIYVGYTCSSSYNFPQTWYAKKHLKLFRFKSFLGF
jgi:hypothetical protein